MPMPSGYGAPITTPDLLPLANRGAGTYTSGYLSDPPSRFAATSVEVYVYVSAVSGSPTLDCSLETSPDGTTWVAVNGSAIPTMSGIGSAVANASVSPTDYVRATSTVSGTGTPTATYRVLALLVSPNNA